MTLVDTTFVPGQTFIDQDGFIDRGVRQAAFVIETIGKLPPGVDPVRFEFTAKNRSIPRRPWSFGVGVTTARHDYPGTIHRPTEQIINVHFKPWTLTGRLADKWNTPGFAVETWRALERLAGLGTMVRCSYRSVYCDGIMTDVDFDYFHEAEIGYSFTLSPHNREPGQQLQSSPRTVLNSKQLLEELLVVRDELVDFHDNAPRFFIAGSLWQDVTELIEEMNTNIDLLDNIINQRILLPEVEPGIALQRIAALFRTVRSNAESILDTLQVVRSDTDLTINKALQILFFDVWQKGILKSANMMVIQSERASREMQSRAQPGLIALYSPSAGEHLMKVANIFYGSPLNWRRIATRNNLGSALTLTGEELLIIPEAVARQ